MKILYSSIFSIHSQIYINSTLFRLDSISIHTTILETPALNSIGKPVSGMPDRWQMSTSGTQDVLMIVMVDAQVWEGMVPHTDNEQASERLTKRLLNARKHASERETDGRRGLPPCFMRKWSIGPRQEGFD